MTSMTSQWGSSFIARWSCPSWNIVPVCGHYIQWSSGVTLYQGVPGSKFSKAPLVEVLKARVEHRICTSFLGGPGHVHPENFWIYTLWNAISWTLGRDFTEFWWSENDIVTYQRPWPMFLLYRLNLGAPIWPIEVGGPRVLPVWAHSSYATAMKHRALIENIHRRRPQSLYWITRHRIFHTWTDS
jgi:hypothetical protein